MLLIYTNTSTKRLQYICKFIFKEYYGIAYNLTTEFQSFTEHQGAKLNYSNRDVPEAYQIVPQHLLFENTIRPQQISCVVAEEFKCFFHNTTGDYSFDIFAAIFYLISRYEEYLPYEKDIYNRFPHKASLAFQNDFLQQPLVNVWLKSFARSLVKRFPELVLTLPTFRFTPSYDIDIAWSYKHKGVLRNIGGFIRKPSLERLSVLAGLKKDPYSCYEFLNTLHQKYKLDALYFFLVATSRSDYDKNISPFSPSMGQLIRTHAKKYEIGLHPSWKSNDNIHVLRKERKALEDTAHVHVSKSRQHYIRFRLPGTMEKLLEAGIENDYSMGYGSINGFRASIANSFSWFNLEKDSPTRLRIHPFCFMDANSYYEQNLSAEAALQELTGYLKFCKDYNGHLITIFHNNFLGTVRRFTDWRLMYERFISQLQESPFPFPS